MRQTMPEGLTALLSAKRERGRMSEIPPIPDAGGEAPMRLEELADIINAFNASTAQLTASHEALQAKVEELTGELSRKNAELSASLEEVQALKNYLANILESITDGVVAINPDGTVAAVNQAAAETIPEIGPEQEGRGIEEVLPAGCRELGVLLRRALGGERQLNREIEVTPAAGRRVLTVSASPIQNAQGARLGAVVTFRDLTEKKALEERLARTNRLAALGEMAAGVAHEIRNPLGGIELYASLLQKRLGGEQVREADLAGKIIAASSSLNRIVEDMLTFTRSREPMRRAVPVEHIVHTAMDLAVGALEEKGIEWRTSFGTDRARVMLDPDLLARAFLNVILNAAQAMEPGGTLQVTARFREETERPGGRRLEVVFADNGPGIPPEVAQNIFNPFFTTRKEGTGLGLAITHKVVQDHGGGVAVEPNLPTGTRIVFDLPAREPVE